MAGLLLVACSSTSPSSFTGTCNYSGTQDTSNLDWSDVTITKNQLVVNRNANAQNSQQTTWSYDDMGNGRISILDKGTPRAYYIKLDNDKQLEIRPADPDSGNLFGQPDVFDRVAQY